MDPSFRHHCLIYDGAPSRHLPSMAAVIREKLERNHRCLYLGSRPMVAGMGSYLAAAGVDVARETDRGSLVLSSDQGHLTEGRFDVDRMMLTLAEAVETALHEGYVGVWATGDMTWEMGGDMDLEKLLEYEWRLEEFMQANPALGGICQYHAATLPREALHYGLVTHPSLFVNQTLSALNPHYVPRNAFTRKAACRAETDSAVQRLCQS